MEQMSSREKSVNDLIGFSKVNKTDRQTRFENQRMDWSDREIQMAILYKNQLLLEKLEKVRSNSSKIVWWLIAIPIILILIAFFLYILSASLLSIR